MKDFFGESGFGREENFIGNDIILVTNSVLVENNMPRNTPMRSDSTIMALVTQGKGTFRINYEKYKLEKGILLKMPIGTLMSIESLSADWNLQVLDFRIPETVSSSLFFYRLDMIDLSKEDYSVMLKYFDLLKYCVKVPELDFSARCIVQAMVYNANVISANASRIPESSVSRAKRTYFNFMSELLRNRESIERSVGFYAKQLGISENGLSNYVKEASNETVLQWINRVSIDNAKILLRNNMLSVAEISYKSGFKDTSSFCRFFKKETGMTPAEYRKSVNN